MTQPRMQVPVTDVAAKGGHLSTYVARPEAQEERKALRAEMLDDAKRIITGDRDKQYSGPEESFTATAQLWSVLFDREFTPSEVAMALAALKLSRLKTGGVKQRDTWTDLAGYAACGFEVSESGNA